MSDKYPARKLKYNDSDKERFPRADEKRKPGDERPDFEIDRSRIIHSSAFRRLQGKTQVFSPGEGDFYRTRLTHSLEVAQIGKGLALRLGADTDLVEAICLAHDLGHPPFGHAGEEALKKLMKECGGFDANAQNIQILASLERRRPEYNGLNLTRATLDGLLKYKSAYDPNKGQIKFYYCNLDSTAAVEWAAQYSHPDFTTQSFECQIMDWADEIAYSVHDFEDAVHSRLISLETFHDTNVSGSVFNAVRDKIPPKVNSTPANVIIEAEWNELIKLAEKHLRLEDPDPAIRRAYRKRLTSHLIEYFIRSAKRKEIEGTKTDRYRYSLDIPIEVRTRQLLLNKLIYLKVMKSFSVQTLEAKGISMIKALFETITTKPDDMFPEDWRPRVKNCSGNKNDIARLACDYISGMTDAFAQKLYSRLFVPGAGSVFEPF